MNEPAPVVILDAYEREMGREARERQRELAKTHYMCCGMPRSSDHHDDCRYFRPAAVIEGQVALC